MFILILKVIFILEVFFMTWFEDVSMTYSNFLLTRWHLLSFHRAISESTTSNFNCNFIIILAHLAPGQIRRPDNSVLYLALHGLLRAATRLTCIFVSPSARAWSVIFWNFMPKSTLVSGWWKVTQKTCAIILLKLLDRNVEICWLDWNENLTWWNWIYLSWERTMLMVLTATCGSESTPGRDQL